MWLLRGTLVAAAVVGVAAAVDVFGSGSPTAPSPAVAAVLGRLADVAAAGPSTVPGPGQYLYVDSENDYPSITEARHGLCVTHATEHRRIWIGADGSGLLRETAGATTFTSPADRAACQTVISNDQLVGGRTSDLWFAPRCFMLGPTNDMRALSTDPRVLLAEMRRIDGGPPGPAEDFVHVGDFLRETDASPALRAALYRAAALIPGVRLLGGVRDHLGRLGLGVAYDAHGERQELIFNPRTSALMGEQVVAASGSASSWAVYRESRIVDRLPGRPPAPLTPPCVNGGGIGRQTPHGAVMVGPTGGHTGPAGLTPQPRTGG
jgi:hypothetical protein